MSPAALACISACVCYKWYPLRSTISVKAHSIPAVFFLSFFFLKERKIDMQEVIYLNISAFKKQKKKKRKKNQGYLLRCADEFVSGCRPLRWSLAVIVSHNSRRLCSLTLRAGMVAQCFVSGVNVDSFMNGGKQMSECLTVYCPVALKFQSISILLETTKLVNE